MAPQIRYLLALLVTVSANTAIQAQQAESTATATPGVWHKGQYIGYVPAHEKQSGQHESPAPQRADRQAAPAIQPQGDVQAASYEKEVVATQSAPIIAVGAPNQWIEATETVQSFCFGNRCWWGGADYLLWSTQGMQVPALATTGNAADPLPAAIGQPGTQILFGNTEFNDASRSGGRFTIGKWLNECRSSGIELSYLSLENEDTRFGASNNDFAVLARPFFNTVTNAQDSRLIATPGVVSGTLNVVATTEFQTLEVLYRHAWLETPSTRIQWLLGYRFAELEDRVAFSESTLSLAGATVGTTFDMLEQFDSRNTFNGAEFGIALQSALSPCWSWEAVAKVALGSSTYRAGITGQTTTTDNVGNSATRQGGLLTQGTNLGSYRWDEFASMSEIAINFKREFECGWTAVFGYTFLYWNGVARAGEQIDTTINASQIPPGNLAGEARPNFPFRSTDFWAQGLRIGLECNF